MQLENSLKHKFPGLCEEWHPTKNVDVSPDNIAAGSHIKVWWMCKKGHEWQASPNHRTSKGRGCPYCCHNPKVLKGHNDLASQYPEIAKEWNYEKNGDLKPDEVTSSSSKKVWWKCDRGHEWKTTLCHRVTSKSKCPYCNLYFQTSFPEQAIFYYVQSAYPDAVNGYTECFHNHGMELDIFIPSLKIGIEYDGIAFHRGEKNKKRDREKYQICKTHSIKLIRVREDESSLNDNCDIVILNNSGIDQVIFDLKKELPLLSVSNIKEDEIKIRESYHLVFLNNSLEVKRPDLTREWNYERNRTLVPSMFLENSNISVWWKCDKGHEWQTTIDSRVRGNGCPYCSGNKVLAGFNDVATLRPNLVEEWNYEKNGIIVPEGCTVGCKKKVWWKCKNGHEWQAVISSRSNGIGCPICANISRGKKRHELSISMANIEKSLPELAKEWNYQKNGQLLPSDFALNSKQKVWWLGKCGHEWQAVIGNRARGAGCPYCSGKNVQVGYNDLQTTNPKLAQEWNWEKNDGLKPENVSAGSRKKVWWLCREGHEWQATVDSRNRGTGCPICSGKKVISGENDLATLMPELVSEWDCEKNTDILPNDVRPMSSKKVWWKCRKCGYEWKCAISNRSIGHGCPRCARHKIK